MSTPPIAITAAFNVTLQTGPLILAHIINWGLFGALVTQVYLYYIAFPRDTPLSKAIVVFIFSIEIVQVVLSTHDAFRLFGSGWGNPLELDRIGLLGISIPLLIGIISCACQVFYARRIFTLSSNLWLSGAISALAVVQGSFGVAAGVKATRLTHLSLLSTDPIFHWVSIVWASGSVLCHIVVTTTMLYYLIKAKSTSSARRTTSLLTRLITFTLETGLLCAVVNVISFILFLSSRSTLMFVVPLATTSKLYSNCMLAMFNSRIRIVGGRDTAAVEELFISTFNFGSSTGTKSSKNYLHTPADSHPGIRIEMTRITDADVHDDSDVLVMDSSKIQRFKPDDYSFAENQRGGEVHE